MAPPYQRSRRNKKSRSRSRKRGPRNKSVPNNLKKVSPNQEEPTGVAGCSGISKNCSDIQTNPEVLNQEASQILSLAEEVATAAILRAGTALRDSTERKEECKLQGDSVSVQSVSLKNNLKGTKVKMTKGVNEEKVSINDDKLNNLSDLLNRLELQYGTQSLPSSPLKSVKNDTTKTSSLRAKSPPKAVLLDNPPKLDNKSNKTNQKGKNVSNKSKENIQSTLIKKSPLITEENKTNEYDENEKEISQEEKQALRKARKEAKQNKQGKPKDSLNPTLTKVKVSVKDQSLVEPVKSGSPEKSKADLKKERRDKQEKDRVLKEQLKVEKSKPKENVEPQKSLKVTVAKKQVKNKLPTLTLPLKRIPLLGHLATPKDNNAPLFNHEAIHPAIRTIGLRMKDGIIDGCNARVLATLSAIVALIEDYKTPPSCDLARDLSSKVDPNISFLGSCRPIPEPMNNAIRFVKKEMNGIASSTPEAQAKEMLVQSIDTYIHQHIILASEAIKEHALQLMDENDVILTFGFSSLVFDTIEEFVQRGRKLSVIVSDNPRLNSGVMMLKKLKSLGVKVYYRLLTDLPHIINKVTKVIVEAEAVVLNGAVMGPCGMAGLVLLASTHSVPVIVLCHTYKFCNIDLTDSLVVNELSLPASSSLISPNPHLNVVSLVYDVTPSQLVNVLVTEQNNFPTSVVPIIIKRNYADILGQD